ncbi:protein ripply2-like [Denticeps clupeoides]|uniref:protein ripply2-like n=1 Tax=Denticeps clupeoides TaxID=299321 RepID=UPI0010A40F7E|nr:protein ripply2-like [Denticeps clupeoides]XP_028858362.1 protein ripply2-like [Denticeps clupeoides]
MDTVTTRTATCSSVRVHADLSAQGAPRPRAQLWRPWIKGDSRNKPYRRPTAASADVKETRRFSHPVKLMWPRSRCYDFLYQEAALLLQVYPVQATICPYEDSSSDEEDSDHDEKELN